MGSIVKRMVPMLFLTSVLLFLAGSLVLANSSQQWYLTHTVTTAITADDTTTHSTNNVMRKTNGATTSKFGLNSGNWDWWDEDEPNYLSAVRVQNTVATGTLTSIELLVNDATPEGDVRLGIFADSGNYPGALLLDAGTTDVINGWTTIDGLSLPVDAVTSYWLAYTLEKQNNIRYYRTGQPGNSNRFVARPYSPLPLSYPGVSGADNVRAVMRAKVGYPIGSGSTITAWWYSDSAALETVAFGEGTFRTQVYYASACSSGTLFADVFSVSPDGTTQTKLASGSITVTTGVDNGIEIECGDEPTTDQTVPQDYYLALRLSYDPDGGVCNQIIVFCNGSDTAYLESPGTDPGFPMPELPTIVLMAGGLSCLVLFVILRQRRSKTNVRVLE